MREIRPAILVLEDGLSFEGTSFGSPGETTGELVFNTSMTLPLLPSLYTLWGE